jgi:AcrR family transcriptional regulator
MALCRRLATVPGRLSLKGSLVDVDIVKIEVEDGSMGVKRNDPDRPYHHGNLKAALLDAAERVLDREGLAGLTLRAAAREAGVSHAAPRHAVGDLSGLLADLAARGFDRLRARMGAEAGTGLHGLGRCYVDFARRNPDLFQLMFRHERLEAGRPALVAARRRLLETLRGGIGQQQGGGDARLAMLAAWAQAHGLAMLLLDRQLPAELASDDVVERLLGTAAIHPC